MLFYQVLDCAEAMERMLTVIKLDGVMFRGDFLICFFAVASVVMTCLKLLFLHCSNTLVRL